jgi:hypothetical protein
MKSTAFHAPASWTPHPANRSGFARNCARSESKREHRTLDEQDGAKERPSRWSARAELDADSGYPRTETPENESTASPRTGCPKKRAGSKWLQRSRFSTCARV